MSGPMTLSATTTEPKRLKGLLMEPVVLAIAGAKHARIPILHWEAARDVEYTSIPGESVRRCQPGDSKLILQCRIPTNDFAELIASCQLPVTGKVIGADDLDLTGPSCNFTERVAINSRDSKEADGATSFTLTIPLRHRRENKC